MKPAVIAVLVLLIAVGGFMLWRTSQHQPTDDQSASAAEVAALREELEASEAERRQLQQELADTGNLVRELETQAALLDQAQAVDAAIDAEAAMESAEEESEESDNEKSTLDDIRAQIRGNAVAKAQITALSELMYADFLNGVEMDADTKAAVRELLVDSYMEVMALTRYALQDENATWADLRAWTLDERDILNQQLRGQLPDDAYRTWNDYAVDLDARQLDGTLRSQIRTLASGLTQENFDLVMQVAVAEFRAEQIALEQSDALFTMEENVNYQLRAMDAMREQLQGMLSEDQFAEVMNFLTFGENALNAQLAQTQQAQQN